MKTKHIIAAAVLLFIVALYIYNMPTANDRALRQFVQQFGSSLMKDSAEIDSIVSYPSTGEVKFLDFRAGNPQSYAQDKSAIEFESGSVIYDPNTTEDSKILVINEIRIFNPRINYIFRADSTTNIDTLLKNAKDSIMMAEKESFADPKSQHKLIVKKVTISQSYMTIGHELAPELKIYGTIPALVLHNIGDKNAPANASVVLRQILEALTISSKKVASFQFVKEVGAVKALKMGVGGKLTPELRKALDKVQ